MVVHGDMAAFLSADEYLDRDEATVYALAQELTSPLGQVATAENIFNFVRDRIDHPWDTRGHRLTLSGSQVLREKSGVCWGQANLLGALARGCGIAAGICYQRLTFTDTPERGYVIHALNALYLNGSWVKVDPRKKEWSFSLTGDGGGFPIRPHYGEVDYPGIYPKPWAFTMEGLKAEGDPLLPYRRRLLSPRGSAALVVVDVQGGVPTQPDYREIAPINRLIAQAQKNRVPVFYLRTLGDSHIISGSKAVGLGGAVSSGGEVVPGVEVLSDGEVGLGEKVSLGGEVGLGSISVSNSAEGFCPATDGKSSATFRALPGTDLAPSDLSPALDIVSPYIFTKAEPSGFANDGFLQALKQMGIHSLTVIGLNHNNGVTATALDGSKLEFVVSTPNL